jgi:hypothetical protein
MPFLFNLLSASTVISIAGGVTAVFIIVSWVLKYHWRKYTITSSGGTRIKETYYIVSALLWVIMILSGAQIIF